MKYAAVKNLSPFYEYNIKLPRKLKKRMKKYLGVHWEGFSNGERLWHYLEHTNPEYKEFLINEMVENYL